jgi:hypothetical protein
LWPIAGVASGYITKLKEKTLHVCGEQTQKQKKIKNPLTIAIST